MSNGHPSLKRSASQLSLFSRTEGQTSHANGQLSTGGKLVAERSSDSNGNPFGSDSVWETVSSSHAGSQLSSCTELTICMAGLTLSTGEEAELASRAF